MTKTNLKNVNEALITEYMELTMWNDNTAAGNLRGACICMLLDRSSRCKRTVNMLPGMDMNKAVKMK